MDHHSSIKKSDQSLRKLNWKLGIPEASKAPNKLSTQTEHAPIAEPPHILSKNAVIGPEK
jgi:hypothetical protein